MWYCRWIRGTLFKNGVCGMTNARALFVCICYILISTAVIAAESPIADEINPLLAMPDERPSLPEAAPAGAGFGKLFDDANLTLSTTYYGRARSADNRGRDARKHANEIHVNALGNRADFVSGYAWGIVGFDVSGQTNLGSGRGWSEVLRHKEPQNKDYSSVMLAQAALKTRFGGEDVAIETRGGWTPISIGSMGTSGGLFPH